MKITKTIYWVVLNGKRHCSFDNIQEANFMVAYLKDLYRDEAKEVKIEADAMWRDGDD